MRIPKYVYYGSAVGTGIGLFVLLKDALGNKRYDANISLAGRTILITGTTSGVGKEVARDLAKRGGKVVMACRDMEKCKKVKEEIINESFNSNIHCKHLDLTSLASVRKFAQDFLSSEKRLDILVNNAGVMTKERKVTEDGFEFHLGVNYLSQFLLTSLLVPKLEECAPSRIILTTCVGYEHGKLLFGDFNNERRFISHEAYDKSKLALVIYGRELAERLQKKGVTVNMVNPGMVDSLLRRELGANKSWSWIIFRPFSFFLLQTPVKGAQTTLYAVLEPSIATHSGCLYSDCKEVQIIDSALNKDTSKRLYLISEKWTEDRSLGSTESQQNNSTGDIKKVTAPHKSNVTSSQHIIGSKSGASTL